MNCLLSEAIMNSRYRGRLIESHIRKLKRVHNLGQYLEVRKFACVYLKIKPNQLSKSELYRKMMQYGIKLSTKHPSETNNNFENSNLKSIIFLVKNKTFYNYILTKLKIFCKQNNIILKYFADSRFGMFLVQFD